MLICPNCKSEYQEGYAICNDCECELIEKPEVDEEDMTVKKDSKISQFIGKLLIFGVVFVIGFIILMSSINLGDHEMSNIMKAHGGSMDTNTYLIYLEQSIIKYRILGSILSLLGGIGILTTTNSKS
ncbi:hypothetical protein G9F72_019455 [Clostridium estertheticum]|uniref:hypothetical protein n=1 Tax=Clostridium estertheticum TaxID=238834 RepID=UPI001CD16149|nr:hypothetical protein [Clostridium estertheticum]MBZ9688509.1 hypothetical protein [Clostridium estertheticum]